MQLHLVTTVENEEGRHIEREEGLGHGTVVLDRLLQPWLGAGTRIVRADSYFSSYEATAHLRWRGLPFIGVVKIATGKFLMRLLKAKPVENRRHWLSFAHEDENCDVAEINLVPVDRERRYFMSSTSSAATGPQYKRIFWHQTETGPAPVALTVEQPQCIEMYYSACAGIDQQNRCRQDDPRLERTHVTHDWSMRVEVSLLSMCIVEA